MIAAYVAAFLEVACGGVSEKAVWIGSDLRASSPGIAKWVAAAVAASGWTPRWAGAVPTPALASQAVSEGVPAIMVTGSHIPAEYNGLKFYRPDGELLKSDEEPIRERTERLLNDPSFSGPSGSFAVPVADRAVAEAYLTRLTTCLSPNALAGLRVGVFEHSAVGRDLLVTLLEALGAEVIRLSRSLEFVAVDTEAVSPEHMKLMGEALRNERLDAVVSTDGDGDRPLVLDEAGNQINGDVLGALTARALRADIIVTPLTSTSAIETSLWFNRVIRTRIGSPYVVEEMAAAQGEIIAGFEANGGFLLGSVARLGTGTLAPLATRDAMLPIVLVLLESRRRNLPLSQLVTELPSRVMRADRLKNVAPEIGNELVKRLAASRELRARFGEHLADPVAINTLDGTRLTLSGDTVIHFRQSGNAPELRCYVETDSAEETNALLIEMMGRIAGHIEGESQP